MGLSDQSDDNFLTYFKNILSCWYFQLANIPEKIDFSLKTTNCYNSAKKEYIGLIFFTYILFFIEPRDSAKKIAQRIHVGNFLEF